MPATEVSPKGLFTLAAHEGIVPGPYRDSKGVWTYGVGHTKFAGGIDPEDLTRGMPTNVDLEISKVFDLFKVDIQKYTKDVLAKVYWDITQEQLDGLVSFHYNTGAIEEASFMGFMATDPIEARRRFMLWNKPSEILPRRVEEAELIFEGIYPSKNVTVWSVDTYGKVVWKPVKIFDFADFMEYMRPQNERKFVDVRFTKEDFEMFRELTRTYFRP